MLANKNAVNAGNKERSTGRDVEFDRIGGMSIGGSTPMAWSVLEDDEPLILEATAAMLEERDVRP
jgi:hypothetical protein